MFALHKTQHFEKVVDSKTGKMRQASFSPKTRSKKAQILGHADLPFKQKVFPAVNRDSCPSDLPWM